MVYLIPVVLAFITFLYNYRKLHILKKDIKKYKIMSSSDSDKIDKLSEAFNGFQLTIENRVTKLETRMGMYFGGYSLIGIVMLVYNIMK